MTTFTLEALTARLRENPDLAASNLHGPHAGQPVTVALPSGPSRLEAKFAQLWRILEGPELATEHRFDAVRMWRLDFAHLATKIAVELEGGIWKQGRHNRPAGFRSDCIKYNAATAQGWRVFRLTVDMIDPDNVMPILELIREGADRDA